MLLAEETNVRHHRLPTESRPWGCNTSFVPPCSHCLAQFVNETYIRKFGYYWYWVDAFCGRFHTILYVRLRRRRAKHWNCSILVFGAIILLHAGILPVSDHFCLQSRFVAIVYLKEVIVMMSAEFGFSKASARSIQNNGFMVDDDEYNEDWSDSSLIEAGNSVPDRDVMLSVDGDIPVNQCFPVAAGNLVLPPRSPTRLQKIEGRQAAIGSVLDDDDMLCHWSLDSTMAHSPGNQFEIARCRSYGASGARSGNAFVAWPNERLQGATPGHCCLTPCACTPDSDNLYRSLSLPPPPARPALPGPQTPVIPNGPAAGTPARVYCGHCNSSFGKAKELRRHEESVHQSDNSPVFRCLCGYKQVRKDNYKRHVIQCKGSTLR